MCVYSSIEVESFKTVTIDYSSRSSHQESGLRLRAFALEQPSDLLFPWLDPNSFNFLSELRVTLFGVLCMLISVNLVSCKSDTLLSMRCIRSNGVFYSFVIYPSSKCDRQLSHPVLT